MLVVWYIAASVTGSQLILPTPQKAFSELIAYLSMGAFYKAFALTIMRATISFLIAFVLAIAVSMAALVCRPLRLILNTVVAVVRSVPTISVILLFIIWTGSELTPMFVATAVVFPTLYSSITAAKESIDVSLEESAKIYALPLLSKIGRIYIPLCAPSVLTSASAAASLNLKLIVAAELLAQTRHSIGLMMQLNQIYFETGALLALTIAVVVAAAVFEGVILLIKRLTCRWWY